MLRSAVGKVMWVRRATVFLVGLAVILAMVMGLASAAFSATGGNFILGQSNSANKPTTLVGEIVNTARSTLVLTNPNGGSALQLQVNSGQAPLKANAAAGTATGLSADELDGKTSSAFWSGQTYRDRVDATISGIQASGTADCDSGDVALGGGYNLDSSHSRVSQTELVRDHYRVDWVAGSDVTSKGGSVHVLCADFAPLRPPPIEPL